MTRTIAALLLACCVVGVFAAPAAQADRSQETIFDASNDLLRADTVAAREHVLDQLQELGVDTVRIVIPWRLIVPSPGAPQMPAGFDPTDPADYEGTVIDSVDAAIRGADQRGIRVLLTPSAPIPNWASASGASSLASPLPSAFEQLMIGLGRRYDGTFGCRLPVCVPILGLPIPPNLLPIPRVGFWAIWSEPNLDLFLRPQKRRGKSVSGAIYRQLFLAGREGLSQSGHGSDPVLIGETSPSSGVTSTAPLDFLRQVLCLDWKFRRRGSCVPIDAAGWAHHPYDPKGTPLKVSSGRVLGVPTLNILTTALARAAQTGATTTRLPVYVTEYGVKTRPGSDGVSLARQAEYIGLTEYQLWRNPQVRSYGQYLLADDRPSDQFAFQTGLLTNAGARKPSYSAFPIALVIRKAGSMVRVWGHVRPGTGSHRVTVETRDGRGKIAVVGEVTTDAGGYFQLVAAKGRAQAWRAVSELPGGRVLIGPFIGSYAF
jgi:hypothetical protein